MRASGFDAVLTKIAIFLAVLLGVFVVARMGAASANRPAGRPIFRRQKKKARAEEMIPCRVCGAYIAKGEGCSCGGTPTP